VSGCPLRRAIFAVERLNEYILHYTFDTHPFLLLIFALFATHTVREEVETLVETLCPKSTQPPSPSIGRA
jgi:hypothetical protein